jgi:iron(III) transport system ATP-binding protein
MAAGVQIVGVTKRFGQVAAVDRVSLTVNPGELFFLLGPSGCGKTTLLRCIAGFYQPDAGAILIGAADVTRMPAHARDTGMVFQSYALWPHLTVAGNVGFGLEMRGLARAEIARRVAEALALVRMSEKAGESPNRLSGGQQQRVALARALVVQPRCLLLDEPLSNLDAKLRLEMRSEIRRICKAAGMTAIYVTHDQKEALSVADRLAVLHAGRVRQVGTPREVYLRPADAFVAGFIGETNFIPGRVAAVADGRCTVATAAGPVCAAAGAAAGLKIGAAVTLSIRPEAVRLGGDRATVPNAFAARAHHTVYLGEVAQHQVTVPAVGGGEDLTLKVFELNPRVMARDTSEETVAWVDPADVVVIEDAR